MSVVSYSVKVHGGSLSVELHLLNVRDHSLSVSVSLSGTFYNTDVRRLKHG